MCEFKNVTILAVTRMLNAFCVAGISNNEWIRPTRGAPNYHLIRSDLFHGNVCIIQNYNIVRFRFIQKLNNKPQSEDWFMDLSYTPSVIAALYQNNRIKVFDNIDETNDIKNDIYDYLISNDRSLIMIKPDRVTNCSWVDTYNGRYRPRVQFICKDNQYDYPCTDLRWRAFGRILNNRTQSINLLNGNITYLVIGLTRQLLHDRYWPMIVGVLTIPDININIDYDNL